MCVAVCATLLCDVCNTLCRVVPAWSVPLTVPWVGAGLRSRTLSVVQGQPIVPAHREYIGPVAGALPTKHHLKAVNGTTVEASEVCARAANTTSEHGKPF